MARGNPYDFERVVERYLNSKYGRIEKKPHKDGSHPDFVFHHLWIWATYAIDAKHKPSGISYQDIYKLQRDMFTYGLAYGILYVSSDTKVSEKMIRHAHAVGISFLRLGWNGHVLEEF